MPQMAARNRAPPETEVTEVTEVTEAPRLHPTNKCVPRAWPACDVTRDPFGAHQEAMPSECQAYCHHVGFSSTAQVCITCWATRASSTPEQQVASPEHHS